MTDAATLAKIKRIARDVRLWAEGLQGRQELWDDDLSCMCSIASYELFKRLRKVHLEPTACFADLQDYGHAFIHCQGYIVDVTATQFTKKLPKVVVLPLKDINYKTYDFWRPKIKVKSKKRFLDEISDWPRDQVHPELSTEISAAKPKRHAARIGHEA